MPTYSVSASPNPVSEGAGSVTFTVTRSGSFPAETIYVSTPERVGAGVCEQPRRLRHQSQQPAGGVCRGTDDRDGAVSGRGWYS